ESTIQSMTSRKIWGPLKLSFLPRIQTGDPVGGAIPRPDGGLGKVAVSDPASGAQDAAPADSGWQVVGAAIAAKILFFVFGAESYLILGNQPTHGIREWLGGFKRWDSVHYLNIAEHGYGPDGPSRDLLAFFPGYPWAVRASHLLFQDYLVSGLFVSSVSSVVAAVLLFRLAELELSRQAARRALWFL